MNGTAGRASSNFAVNIQGAVMASIPPIDRLQNIADMRCVLKSWLDDNYQVETDKTDESAVVEGSR